MVEPGKQLGISMRGGSDHGLGIYITAVDEGSVADTYGLKVCAWNVHMCVHVYQSVKAGDQILEVNGISFIKILHAEAAKILKLVAI